MRFNNYVLVFYFKNFKGRNVQTPRGVNLQKNYYKILEIENTASQMHIKKSYLRLAKKLHPDVNPKGHLQFTQIQEAYNILCDKQLKNFYDLNNTFYPSSQKPAKQQQNSAEYEDLNYKNQHFYEQMRNKGFGDYCEQKARSQESRRDEQYEEEKKETEQEARARKKIEIEIELARRILFTRNPIWQRANAFMNYEQRQRYGQQKQKQFEELFPKGNTLASKIKKWI